MQTPRRFLTISDAAAFLGVHPDTLRNWEKKGILVPMRLPGRTDRRYRREDLEKLVSP